jgi:S1-C subfamily serine protease
MRSLRSLQLLVLALGISCTILLTLRFARPHNPNGVARRACVEILFDGHLESSGWFADSEGHVITAGHALRNTAGAYEVLWPGHGRYPASVVGIDPGHDIGLLKVAALDGPTPFLRLASSIPPAGTRVHLYGMAQYRHGVSIGGQVARATTTFNYYAHLRWPTRCYLVAAPAPPGVSGGPGLDDGGGVVGTQSGFINQGSASSGLAIVSPPDAIRHLLRCKAPVKRATMGCGFEELWSQQPGFIRRLPPGTEGIVTFPLEPGGPAEKAGITRETVIRAIDGHPVRYQHEMIGELQSHAPGDTLALDVIEPGATAPRTVNLTLGEVPP